MSAHSTISILHTAVQNAAGFRLSASFRLSATRFVSSVSSHGIHNGFAACEGKGFVTDSKELCGPSIELVYNDTHRFDVSELVCAEGKRMMLDKDWLLLHALQSLLHTLQASHTDNLEIGSGVSMTVVS